LDIATGTGLAARAFARITHAPQQIVGIDVSHDMLQAAAAASTSSYLQADAAQLPFRPATFDALLCVAAIPYLPDLAKAVTEQQLVRVWRSSTVPRPCRPRFAPLIARQIPRASRRPNDIIEPDQGERQPVEYQPRRDWPTVVMSWHSGCACPIVMHGAEPEVMRLNGGEISRPADTSRWPTRTFTAEFDV
jgi:SAM-dependent methyltransferase